MSWRGVTVALFLDGTYEDESYYVAVAAMAGAVVAADGGARFLRRNGVVPDLLVGDFDSLPAEDLRALADAGAEVLRHPVRKDATDGELAIEEIFSRGAGEVLLAGALGALDHTWGHLVLLRRAAERGATALLVSPNLVGRVLVAGQNASLDAQPGARVSLLPLAGDARVTLRGLEYELAEAELPGDTSLGLGNAVRDRATVEVHDGVVAVLVFDGAERFGWRDSETRAS